MNICIVTPAEAHKAYAIAAETFSALAKEVAGAFAQIVTDDQYQRAPVPSDLTVLIGNDAVNAVTAELYLETELDRLGIRYGSDDYCIRTLAHGEQPILLLAGGRPRAAIYAVYRYFEYFCGCRWFWDGDRIPNVELPVRDLDLTESPRFDYRGLRYFAHRSLHRFQAEHWSFADWTAEIDWILKKRLNLFMLRIGMDDLFQKAFPDIVPYPEEGAGRAPDAGTAYNDRTPFWSLQYRGELRKKILQYAFVRDLMHPEDCGTISHWYSRTPTAFLDRINPTLLPQSNNAYNDPTGRVWDIRDRENFDRYFHLTETHIREYGNPSLFHTIGLGERLYSADPEKNRRMKLYVYHKIVNHIKEHYPNAPLLIASWDLWMHFTSEEVQELVADLDPTQAILFDYTSDTVRDNNFTEWGVMNKFPWVFGIFSGYEPNSEIRGYYELTNERLKLAKSDPMCKGAILWPELSHGDPFVIEYFAQNAWNAETPSIAEQTDRYCHDRYPAAVADEMCAIWRDLMPIVSLTAWSIDKGSYYQTGNDIFTLILRNAKFDPQQIPLYQTKLEHAARQQKNAVDILKRLSKLTPDGDMMQRDLFDMARTILGRYLNAALVQVQYRFVTHQTDETSLRVMRCAEELMQAMIDLLSAHEDYSLLATLNRLETVAPVTPGFEETLKENASNHYCRSYIYENAAYLYLPEMRLVFDEVKQASAEQRELDTNRLTEQAQKIRDRYFETPLCEMQQNPANFAETILRAATLIDGLELE